MVMKMILSKEFETKTKHERRDDLTKDDMENLLHGVEIWAGFWRNNPHRFVEDYLRLHLFVFQQILLYFMMKSNLFCFIACRGLGKSFLTAVFCVVRCILYPGTKVIIVSGNKKQAGLIITEKIKEMKDKSPTLAKEIKRIREGDDPACFFRNGSYIRVSTSGDGARGARGNILIVENLLVYVETCRMKSAKSVKAKFTLNMLIPR